MHNVQNEVNIITASGKNFTLQKQQIIKKVSPVSMHSSSVYHRALINIGVSSATYRSVRLCKLANALSGRKAIMFEDKSLVKNKEID